MPSFLSHAAWVQYQHLLEPQRRYQMPKVHEVTLTPKQMEQLARDAAICAGSALLAHPGTLERGVRAAAQRILKVLKLT